ncbi:DUF5995 family protein [Gordonia hankookensis]|uniref:DUF403 domain-containing protein n=1 Tax=Gordonia hankookensis TaxID=589403 RepID=A0ABR7WHR8_9ACTN|nr:DUF5995 family protein [Gordonia hankookensis]MBD1322309.1 hypothetical protein [Gordonia hankookensis]
MPRPPSPPPPVPPVRTIDEVVAAIDTIVSWSGSESSRLGYFAALYKRITLAVGVAIDDGVFDDGPRMERFDAVFASRYLDAVNGHFHPDRFPKPTRSWRNTFAGADRSDPIILQHMLSGINSHIVLDLGIAAVETVGRRNLVSLRRDFDTVNAVLAGQLNGVVEDLNELSPALADIYATFARHQIFLLNGAIKGCRDSAWRFATVLALEPGFLRRATITARDLQVARQSALAFDPPGLIGVLDRAVVEVASRESRDVAHNIRVLDEVASSPSRIVTELD